MPSQNGWLYSTEILDSDVIFPPSNVSNTLDNPSENHLSRYQPALEELMTDMLERDCVCN